MTTASRGECLWIVSQDEELSQRAERALVGQGCRVRLIPREALESPSFWRTCPRYPGCILLDVGEDLDWARQILGRIKKARVPSPVVVATANNSKEFGTKIVSLGIAYILPRDFAAGELASVFLDLVNPQQRTIPQPRDVVANPPPERGFQP